MPIAPMTSGAMRSLLATAGAIAVVTCDEGPVARRSDRAVVAASRKSNVELLELAVEVRAFEAGLFGHLAHVRLLAAQKLLEIDALERLARFTQRHFEEAGGDLGCNGTIGRDRFAQEPPHKLDADVAADHLKVLDDIREMIEVPGPMRVGERR